jgi:hypothetical protein
VELVEATFQVATNRGRGSCLWLSSKLVYATMGISVNLMAVYNFVIVYDCGMAIVILGSYESFSKQSLVYDCVNSTPRE